MIPTWYQLRMIGKSPLAQLTILIPIVGHILLFSEGWSKFFRYAEIYSLELSPDRLYYLYFGLLIFSISTIVYNISCPSIIKLFDSEYAFVDSELDTITPRRASAIQHELKRRFDFQGEFSLGHDEVEPGDQVERVRTMRNRNNRDLWLTPNSSEVLDLLQTKYRLFDNSRLGLRTFVVSFYVLSAMIISVPTVQTAYRVLIALVDNWRQVA